MLFPDMDLYYSYSNSKARQESFFDFTPKQKIFENSKKMFIDKSSTKECLYFFLPMKYLGDSPTTLDNHVSQNSPYNSISKVTKMLLSFLIEAVNLAIFKDSDKYYDNEISKMINGVKVMQKRIQVDLTYITSKVYKDTFMHEEESIGDSNDISYHNDDGYEFMDVGELLKNDNIKGLLYRIVINDDSIDIKKVMSALVLLNQQNSIPLSIFNNESQFSSERTGSDQNRSNGSNSNNTNRMEDLETSLDEVDTLEAEEVDEAEAEAEEVNSSNRVKKKGRKKKEGCIFQFKVKNHDLPHKVIDSKEHLLQTMYQVFYFGKEDEEEELKTLITTSSNYSYVTLESCYHPLNCFSINNCIEMMRQEGAHEIFLEKLNWEDDIYHKLPAISSISFELDFSYFTPKGMFYIYDLPHAVLMKKMRLDIKGEKKHDSSRNAALDSLLTGKFNNQSFKTQSEKDIDAKEFMKKSDCLMEEYKNLLESKKLLESKYSNETLKQSEEYVSLNNQIKTSGYDTYFRYLNSTSDVNLPSIYRALFSYKNLHNGKINLNGNYLLFDQTNFNGPKLSFRSMFKLNNIRDADDLGLFEPFYRFYHITFRASHSNLLVEEELAIMSKAEHLVVFGHGGSGKSHFIAVLRASRIDGTWINKGSETLGASLDAKGTIDKELRLYEELPAYFFSSYNRNSDKEEMTLAVLKMLGDQMVNRKYQVQVVNPDGTKGWKGVDYEAVFSPVIIGAKNFEGSESTKVFNDGVNNALDDRWRKLFVYSISGSKGGKIVNSIYRNDNTTNYGKEKIFEKNKQLQMLILNITGLIQTGALPQPDLTYALFIIKEYLLRLFIFFPDSIQESRCMKRIKDACRLEVIHEAAEYILSPLSPYCTGEIDENGNLIFDEMDFNNINLYLNHIAPLLFCSLETVVHILTEYTYDLVGHENYKILNSIFGYEYGPNFSAIEFNRYSKKKFSIEDDDNNGDIEMKTVERSKGSEDEIEEKVHQHEKTSDDILLAVNEEIVDDFHNNYLGAYDYKDLKGNNKGAHIHINNLTVHMVLGLLLDIDPKFLLTKPVINEGKSRYSNNQPSCTTYVLKSIAPTKYDEAISLKDEISKKIEQVDKEIFRRKDIEKTSSVQPRIAKLEEAKIVLQNRLKSVDNLPKKLNEERLFHSSEPIIYKTETINGKEFLNLNYFKVNSSMYNLVQSTKGEFNGVCYGDGKLLQILRSLKYRMISAPYIPLVEKNRYHPRLNKNWNDIQSERPELLDSIFCNKEYLDHLPKYKIPILITGDNCFYISYYYLQLDTKVLIKQILSELTYEGTRECEVVLGIEYKNIEKIYDSYVFTKKENPQFISAIKAEFPNIKGDLRKICLEEYLLDKFFSRNFPNDNEIAKKFKFDEIQKRLDKVQYNIRTKLDMFLISKSINLDDNIDEKFNKNACFDRHKIYTGSFADYLKNKFPNIKEYSRKNPEKMGHLLGANFNQYKIENNPKKRKLTSKNESDQKKKKSIHEISERINFASVDESFAF